MSELELRRTYNESNPVQSRNTFWPNPGQIGDFSRQSQAKEECLKRYLLRNGCIEKHQPACRRGKLQRFAGRIIWHITGQRFRRYIMMSSSPDFSKLSARYCFTPTGISNI